MHEVLLIVCSKMADENNLSSKLPVVNRTRDNLHEVSDPIFLEN